MGPHWGGGGMMPFGGGGVGTGFLGPLLWVLLLAVIVLGVVYLVRTTTTSATSQSDRAMAILREQYARGDLSDEEFDNRASRLSQQ